MDEHSAQPSTDVLDRLLEVFEKRYSSQLGTQARGRCPVCGKVYTADVGIPVHMTVMHPGADAEVLRSDTKKRAAARRRSSTKNYVLAIDPGKTTGIVLVRKVDPDSDGEPSIVWSDELSWPQVATRVEATLTSLYADVDLVVERFTITRATASNAQAPWSLEVIGAVKWLAYRHNAGELVMQDPASVMRFASNPRLKSLGFWHKGGKGHALDAIRHAVVFLITKDGWTPSYLV